MTTTPLRSALLLAAALGALFCAAPRLSAANDVPTVNVAVRAEGEALAKGFEEAFNSLQNAPIYITYAREDKGFVTLTGIRSVRALGAVLAIRTDRGPSLVIPAKSVVIITDERPATP
jgi:hypothetical protein